MLTGLVGRPLAVAVSVLVVVGVLGFTKVQGVRRYSLGIPHLLAHMAVATAVLPTVAAVLEPVRAAAFVVSAPVLSALIGGLVSSYVVAAYLLVGDRYGNNTNEVMASQRIEGFKGLLRLHLDPTGTLTIYPVGLREVPRKWKVREGGDPEASWLVPDGDPLAPELIEPPIIVGAPARAADPPT